MVKKSKKKENFNIKNIFTDWSKRSSKITKKDWLVMGILVLLYMIIAVWNLGVFNTPKTYYQFTSEEEEIGVELLGVSQDISIIRYYTGPEVGEFSVIASTDGEIYKEVATLKQNSVFAWEDLEVDNSFKYLKFISKTVGGYIGEIQLYNKYGEKVRVVASDDQSNVIVDESSTVPAKISHLNSMYFDEIYFARSAYEYVHGIDTMEWVHPPLGKLLIALPILIFGMSTFSYRIMGVIAGALMIPVMYILAKKMFKKSKWGLLAGILMTFDCFHFVQTRMGTVDSFLVLFIMLSALFMYQYIDLSKNAKLKDKLRNLFLSGLFIGLSISVKWTGLYAGLALALIFFGYTIYKNFIKKEKDEDLLKIILSCFIFFGLIPVTIYILGYILFPNVVGYYDNSITGIINQIKDMFGYHSGLTEKHDFSSDWYTWPIMYKPVWYYVNYLGGNIKSTIVGIGNPIIWWSGAIASIFILIMSFLKKKKNYLFILLFIVCTWLPYLFIGRDMFMYHYFPTLPFVMLGIVAMIKRITEKTKSNMLYILYAIAVIFFFFVFYPVISGMITTTDYIDSLKWLSSWIF